MAFNPLILLVGAGIAVAATAGRRSGGSSGWHKAGIPGFQIKGDCVALRAHDLSAAESWVNQNQGLIAQWDQVYLEDPVAGMTLFMEEMGCPYVPDMVIHRADGGIFTVQEFMDSWAGAALAPGASIFGTILRG